MRATLHVDVPGESGAPDTTDTSGGAFWGHFYAAFDSDS